MRTSKRDLNPHLSKQIKEMFINAVADLRDPSEAVNFFKDFFTDTEFDIFAKRLAVAYWLKKGRSYSNIKDNLKVSSATVAAVQTMMNKQGFKLAVKKIEAEEWASVWAEKIKKFVGKTEPAK